MMLKKILPILSLIILFSCSNRYNESRHSVIVSKNDKVVFKEYYNGITEDSLTNVQSLSKGVISILIGIAIDENFIASENESIETYFPVEFNSISDKKKSDITIKHLLNQTSGGFLGKGI